jgi:DNA ligase (NAD+)
MAEEYHYPIDGVVFKFNDIEYGKTLGSTEHHFKNAIAYKFYDETYETTLRDIEWSMGRTGILTPIAIFDPVDIDGSTVERASLHNLAIMEQTLHSSRGWQGQRIEVYKANQIIPQIYDAEADDERTKYYFSHPVICPVCKGVVKRIGDNYVCSNPDCEGKLINRLDHFCGKKGLDIKGLSKATLEKLIEWDWVNNFNDIYHLADHKTEWISKPGFGSKSVSNVLDAIEASREVELASFISAIGVPQVGLAIAKKLVMAAPSYEDFREKVDSKYDFSVLDGFADSKTQAILSFNYTAADEVYKEMKIINAPKEEVKDNKLAGITVCITGRLKAFTNRGALVEIITSHEGKVVDRMSQTVEVLINNDIASESAKNKYAKEHGIPILTEEEFKEKYLDF